MLGVVERQDFYTALEALYGRLDDALPRFEGNACGSCYQCCTARGLSRHVVSDLELDYLRERVGTDRLEAFRLYAAREGAEVCPYYEGGCTVYPYRPYSCRTFGHYRAAGTRLPELCVFIGQEREFEPRTFLAELPEARALHRLKRDYLAVRHPAPVLGASAASLPVDSHLDPSDPMDRAWLELMRSDFPAAESAALAAEETPMQQMTLGLARSGRDDWEGARTAFARAVELAPQTADLRYQLARALLELGAFDEASWELDQAVELNPQHAPALAYRGYVDMARGDLAGGVPWLEKSLQVDPSQELVRQRLDLARSRLT